MTKSGCRVIIDFMILSDTFMPERDKLYGI